MGRGVEASAGRPRIHPRGGKSKPSQYNKHEAPARGRNKERETRTNHGPFACLLLSFLAGQVSLAFFSELLSFTLSWTQRERARADKPTARRPSNDRFARTFSILYSHLYTHIPTNPSPPSYLPKCSGPQPHRMSSTHNSCGSATQTCAITIPEHRIPPSLSRPLFRPLFLRFPHRLGGAVRAS